MMEIRMAKPADRVVFSHMMMSYLISEHAAGSKYLPTARTLQFYLNLFDQYLTGSQIGIVLILSSSIGVDCGFLLSGNGTPMFDDAYSPQSVLWAVHAPDDTSRVDLIRVAAVRLSSLGFVSIVSVVRDDGSDMAAVNALEQCGVRWVQRIGYINTVPIAIAASSTTDISVVSDTDAKMDRLERYMLHNMTLVDMPTTNTFIRGTNGAPDMLVREVFNPAGTYITTKVHRTSHPFAILTGSVLVYSDTDGVQRLRAPHSGITKPGTRRLIIAETDVRWVTYHALVPGEIDEDGNGDMDAIEARLIERRELDDGRTAHEMFRECFDRQRVDEVIDVVQMAEVIS